MKKARKIKPGTCLAACTGLLIMCEIFNFK